MRFKIYRIVDVNLNRATEGLRVVEEICRFVLEDKILTAEVKGLRAELSKVSRKLKARRSLEDVGRKLYPESESKRVGVEDIFRANMKRAQEALRCLEEFSKLIDPELGRKFKRIRFKLYDLEKRIAHHLKFDFDLYVITDPMRDHIKTAREAVAGGAKIVQLREKTASKKQILKWAKKMRKLVPIFIINDYADIAKKVRADGIHLGQEDLKKDSVAQTRKRLGEDKIIGVSTHSFSQAVKAEKMGADYISVGPIFSTPSKPGIKPLGLKLLRRVLKRVKIPVVAIGGIKESNIYDVRKTGCKRVAVIRAVLEKKDIKKAVSRLRRMFSC